MFLQIHKPHRVIIDVDIGKSQKSCKKMKTSKASDKFLVGFDLSLPLVLATGSGSVGVSAKLLTTVGTKCAVFFLSFLLAPTEKHYSEINREATKILIKCYLSIYVRQLSPNNKLQTYMFNLASILSNIPCFCLVLT